jgi:hypothetical protein
LSANTIDEIWIFVAELLVIDKNMVSELSENINEVDVS